MIDREEKHVWIVEPDEEAEDQTKKRWLYDRDRDSSGPKVGRFKSNFEEESKREESKEKRKRRSRSRD